MTLFATNLAPHFIAGKFVDGGGPGRVESQDPYSGEVHWSGAEADAGLIDAAVVAARGALREWSFGTRDERIAVVREFAKRVADQAEDLARLVARENGKPLWDARTEINSLGAKVEASLEAYAERANERQREVRGMTSSTRFKAHGVMAVLGPFNFPMSMANSHIMPALLAGNTIVFKPSELTPLSGLTMARIWHEAGLPPGVLNCLSGQAAVGKALVESRDVNGVLFIGSRPTGLAICRALADRPEKIVALEMGGNSPLIIWDYDDRDSAVFCAVQSSMLSAGQRCSAARRLILRADDSGLVEALSRTLSGLAIGHFSEVPEPYYGPMIRPAAVERVVAQFDRLEALGARPLLRPAASGPNGTLLSPGLIDMTGVKDDPDEEIFGPVLKLYRAATLDEAIALANATCFGLAAGIVTRNRADFERYFAEAEAGIINWNQQLTGATSFAPFGGIRQSGNHRSAGYMSVDYCVYPVASFENKALRRPASVPSGYQP